MTVDALCIGHAALDLTFSLPTYPLENVKYHAEDFATCGGGPAANAACLLARYGVATGFVGLIGDDENGQHVARELAEYGVDVRLLERRRDHVTPISCILVNRANGSRTIINHRLLVSGFVPPLDVLGTAQPKLLLFDSHELSASLAALERYPEAVTVLDAGTLRESAVELAQRVDYLVASQDFARQYSGEDTSSDDGQARALEALAELNRRTVVVTLGERGVVARQGTRTLRIEPHRVRVRDTTGAGDIFHGAFCHALLESYDIERALRFANVCAALSVETMGGRTSIPALSTVLQRLNAP
jgi:sugar/nucleoside kinase (ribokinase family)